MMKHKYLNPLIPNLDISFHPVGFLLLNKNRYLIISEDRHSKNNSESISVREISHFELDRNHYKILAGETTSKEAELSEMTAVAILTEREKQIAILVALGQHNKQIAKQLKISNWTVSTHLRRIFTKLGVDNRAAMVYQYFSRE